MPNTPYPDASIWDKYPEVAIIILVALVIVGVFIFYNERRDKQTEQARKDRDEEWRTFMDEQRKAFTTSLDFQRASFKDMLISQKNGQSEILDALVKELKSMRKDAEAHDSRMIEAISRMEERTRPSKGEKDV